MQKWTLAFFEREDIYDVINFRSMLQEILFYKFQFIFSLKISDTNINYKFQSKCTQAPNYNEVRANA